MCHYRYGNQSYNYFPEPYTNYYIYHRPSRMLKLIQHTKEAKADGSLNNIDSPTAKSFSTSNNLTTTNPSCNVLSFWVKQ